MITDVITTDCKADSCLPETVILTGLFEVVGEGGVLVKYDHKEACKTSVPDMYIVASYFVDADTDEITIDACKVRDLHQMDYQECLYNV